MQDKIFNITLSLASMVQAVSLVKELAQTGKINEDAYQANIYSVFQTDPKDIPSVFGGTHGIKLGLEKLIQLCSFQGTKSNRLLIGHMLSLMHLQKKITRSPQLLNQLTQRISQVKKQVDYFHLTHPTVIANLADIYLNTISPFRVKIIIWGSEKSLAVTENIDKIRALLLTGIRGAFLWRQIGGSRLQLLFFRSKIKLMAEKILVNLNYS